MSLERFAKDFAQTLPDSMKREAYDRYIVQTPGRLYYQAATGIGTGLKGNPNRAPLLLVAGESDVTIEPSMVRATYAKQKKSGAVTSFKSFEGRSHFLFAEPGWEEIADYAMSCGQRTSARSAATTWSTKRSTTRSPRAMRRRGRASMPDVRGHASSSSDEADP